MVSVIIPTYNRCSLVGEAVASVLAQRGVAPEVIVVDDGSTDGTLVALESFGASICTVSQPRAGVSAARNHGIRIAQGEWIAFLDSDDLWLPRKLEIQLDYLSRRPDLRICQTEELWVRNGIRINPRKYHAKPQGYCFPLLLDRCLISPSAVVIHRDVLRAVGLFDESLPACEDYDLWLRIGYRYPVGLVQSALTIKRGGHADQLSSTVPALDQYRIRALAGLLRREPLSGAQQKTCLEALTRKCHIYAQGCLRRGKFEEAAFIEALPAEVAMNLENRDRDTGGP